MIPLNLLTVMMVGGFYVFAMMVTKLRMGALPGASTAHITKGKSAPERAGNEIQGLVVVPSDGGTLVCRQLEAEPLQDVDASLSVAATVTPHCLPEVVEQPCDGDAVGRQSASMGEHVFINFEGVLRETAVLLMVAVAAALEVARVLEIPYHRLDAGAPCSAEDGINSVLYVFHMAMSLV